MDQAQEVEVASVADNGGGPGGSLKDRIRAARDNTRRLESIKEWDGVTVEVRSMTGAERAEWMEKTWNEELGRTDFTTFYPELLIATVFDPNTDLPVFDANDANWLQTKNAGVIERLARVALKLSGLDADAVKRAGKGSSESQS